MRLWQIIETPKGRLSSKRVCGVLGWLVLLVGFMVLLFATKEAPSFTEFLICAIEETQRFNAGKYTKSVLVGNTQQWNVMLNQNTQMP